MLHFLVKHPTGINLEELDLEAVDKEMATNEATQASQAAQDPIVAPEGDTPRPGDADEQEAAVADTYLLIFFKKNILGA